MLDSLTYSADGLLGICFLACLILFFLYGPHKVYESIFGAMIALGLYLLIHEMTYVSPEVTRIYFMGVWLVDKRDSILFILKIVAIFLFFFTPATVGLHVNGVARGTLWFFIKLILLSAFFVIFGGALFVLLFTGGGAFDAVDLPFSTIFASQYIKTSHVFAWIIDRSYIILILGSILCLYKILFSHWISSLFAVGAVIYTRGSEVFGKKTFEPEAIHEEHGSDDHGDHHDAHDDHHAAEAHGGHH